MINYCVPFPFPSEEKLIPSTLDDDPFIFPQPYDIMTFYSSFESLPTAPALSSSLQASPAAPGTSAMEISSLIQFLLNPGYQIHTSQYARFNPHPEAVSHSQSLEGIEPDRHRPAAEPRHENSTFLIAWSIDISVHLVVKDRTKESDEESVPFYYLKQNEP
ncbi:uncharacterized protein BT62DRAFT_1007615 [Guyanagaster necrorhizus]|uniref:Uncharacterized protein n=1 Tax=Guyanagaster necrorhizus TaxID=856835 RepID=A0A9P8AR83_9AGAR|nr:uncharacterized protein BT62DRAFT_1007615 [Guyanagaster necrorhizus MCA 3950]KAG7444606.1 hypothetical protein BT62DRAFT_1007615 [Guyanagaster necrorhizus MCA 3950]